MCTTTCRGTLQSCTPITSTVPQCRRRDRSHVEFETEPLPIFMRPRSPVCREPYGSPSQAPTLSCNEIPLPITSKHAIDLESKPLIIHLPSLRIHLFTTHLFFPPSAGPALSQLHCSSRSLSDTSRPPELDSSSCVYFPNQLSPALVLHCRLHFISRPHHALKLRLCSNRHVDALSSAKASI